MTFQPRLYEVLIRGRDEYLLSSLLECCALGGERASSAVGASWEDRDQAWSLWTDEGDTLSKKIGLSGDPQGKSNVVVGIVGLLHVNGMMRLYLDGSRPSGRPKSIWLSDAGTFLPPPTFGLSPTAATFCIICISIHVF